MKEFLKKIVNVKLIVRIIIIVFIVIIFFGAAAYIINILDATNSNHNGTSSWGDLGSRNYAYNMPAQIENNIISQITSSNIIAKGNGDYKLNIDLDEKINEIYSAFEEREEGRRILGYLTGTEEEKKEYLKNMVRAEIATQYPDLRSVDNMGAPVDSDEVQGVIQFKRRVSQEIKKVETINKATSTSLELTGVVCWGDQYTLGNTEDSTDSYPDKLKNLLSSNVYNLGFEDETAEEILLRAGAEGYIFETTGEDFTIGSEIGAEATFLARMKAGERIVGRVFRHCDGSSENKKLKCTIGGVEGELIYSDGHYVFKRTVDGSEVTITSGTEIKIDTQGGYNECIPIIWIGNNNSKFSANETMLQRLITYYKDLIEELENPDDYIAIIPLYYNGDQEYSASEYDSIKNRMQAVFGDKCLDLKAAGWSKNDGYDSLANIIKDKIRQLGFNTGETSQQPGAGQIRFEGTISFGEEITLEYIPLGNKLQPEAGTLRWLIQQEDDDIKNVALQFFSINASGDIVIAKWNRVTTIITNYTNDEVDEGYPTTDIQYSLSTVKVNYKNSISKYIMPFDYLWIFLVMGEDPEFVENLTNLALDSEITATLFDELTIIETNVDKRRTEQSKTEVSETTTETHYGETDPDTGEQEDQYTTTNTRDYTTNEVSTDIRNNTYVKTETNKVRYRLTYADVWCLIYKVEAISADWHIEETQETITTIPDEEWQAVGGERHSNSHSYITNDEGDTTGESSTDRTEQDYRRTINQSTRTTIDQRAYEYNNGTIWTSEKTSKDATLEEKRTRRFNNPTFVKYYLYSEVARSKISSIYSWLFEALEINSSVTSGMVDVTKYMLYKATERDFGVTSYDFSSYNDEDFKDATDYTPANGDYSDPEGTGGTGGDGSLSGDAGEHYWGIYVRGDKEYKCYYQNSYSGTFYNMGCVATAAAIAHSGYGSTKTPMDYWNGRCAVNCGVTKISRDRSRIVSYLNQNVPVIIYNSFPDRAFNGSDGGHAIVLVDINANGEVYVINPFHAGASNEGWQSLDRILSYGPGSGAPNTMGSDGVGIVTN